MDRTCDPCRVKAFAAFRQPALYIGFGGNVTDERDNDPSRLVHPEIWPCDPATLGPVFLGWDTVPGMIELRGVGAVYSVDAGKVYVLQLVPFARAREARQRALDYINAARRLTGK